MSSEDGQPVIDMAELGARLARWRAALDKKALVEEIDQSWRRVAKPI